MQCFEHIFCLLRKLCQCTALDRLHDYDLFAMLYRCLIALAGLYLCILPVQIVQLQLYKFCFRMLCKDLIEHLCTVVKGKSDVLYLALCLFLHCKPKAVQTLHGLIVLRIQRVQKIIVKILHAAFFSLLIENALHILFFLQLHDRQLRRQRIAVAVLARHKHILHRALAFILMIHVRRIKISKTTLHKCIHHLTDGLFVDALLVLLIEKRQAHHSES